ncbi:uncharacterized protein BXIN_2323 [Babesia sp. Xinjiang]|uniref:uncharacterized protein n=1 Tax=Babesia sp. Xinjiang TaxID=462227 RepID=UPI000A228B54|nr:uncharacterized protein BXIN_2323 [Babesia sp. Xinjiang]ORM40800.1 hypothetical protein BXIN_2323 [Babesia sp. Xinjiang]
MSLFAHGTGAQLDARNSPVLSPTNWPRNGRRRFFAEGIDISGSSWKPPMRRFNDSSFLQVDPLPPWNSNLDNVAKPFDAGYGSTPELRALRSRIIDSPGHASGLDVPAYLRSVDTKKFSYTPKRFDAFARSVSPRRNGNIMNNDTSFNFKSPLLTKRSRIRRSSRASLPELRIGAYAPYSQGARSINPTRRYESYNDQMEFHTTPPNKSRINIHATDDILNRIKRSLSECENITRRLDRQYGSRRSQQSLTDYSERVFPRSLADNLFASKGSVAPNYRNSLHVSRSSVEQTNNDIRKRDILESERPKGTLSRILENIKRIRSRTLFTNDATEKRNFVEVEKEVVESPKLRRKTRTLDVDAIQQRIKQQKRSLLSQRTPTRFD